MPSKNNNFSIISGTVILFLTLAVTFFGAQTVLRTASVYVPEEAVSVWYLLFLFLLVAAFIVLLLKFLPGRILFHIFFTIAMFAGVWFMADIFFSGEIALVLGAAMVIFRYLVPRVIVQNILVILGIAGVAVSLGLSLPWKTVLIFGLLLSIYDIAAVYWTGHMIKMMKGLLSHGVVFAAVLPSGPSSFSQRLDQVEPGKDFMLVGTGDLALPAIFVASLVPSSPLVAIFSGLGALIGFIFTSQLFFSQKNHKPMPALPPIVAGMVIGFLISYLL